MISLPIPICRQAYIWSCGCACVASVLYYYDLWAGREPELYEQLNASDEDGTAGHKIIEILRDFGLKAKAVEDLDFEILEYYLKSEQVIILSIQSPDAAWTDKVDTIDWKNTWGDGHYVILSGIDEEHVWIMDPSVPAKYRKLKKNDFERRWHEYSDHGHKEYHSGILISK